MQRMILGCGSRHQAWRTAAVKMQLGALRNVYRVAPGRKIGHVTDIADTADNRRGVIQLIGGADILFIEAPFAGADRALAAERAHLTAVAAGEIARAAKVRHVEPFHFSARYAGQEQGVAAEVAEAFAGVGRPETAREGP